MHTCDPWRSRFAAAHAAMPAPARALFDRHVVHYPNSSLDDGVRAAIGEAAAAARAAGGAVLEIVDSNHELSHADCPPHCMLIA